MSYKNERSFIANKIWNLFSSFYGDFYLLLQKNGMWTLCALEILINKKSRK